MSNRTIVILTHIQLSDETSHIIVFEIEWQEFFGELCLIAYDKAFSILMEMMKEEKD